MAIVLDGTNGINTPDLESAGPVSGTTGTFSGALQASGVATNIYPLVSATAVTASGTSVDFTSIPSWVKRITVMFAGLSTNGTSLPLIQLGSTGGIETTGYLGSAGFISGASTGSANQTAGLGLTNSMSAVSVLNGAATFTHVSSLLWVGTLVAGWSSAGSNILTFGGTSKTLSDTLTQVRITTVNGTDTFDAGTINIMYEG